MSAPLDKVRVLDLSRVLAGPWCTQVLGDYGADVVKVERPGSGDDTRQWGPPWLELDGENEHGQSGYFLATNRNKRSITIDFSTHEGRGLVTVLVSKADILIENYRPGSLQRYGLGPHELLEKNPHLICCSISAYGQEGSRADRPGYDAMIQASTGLMSVTGSADGEPQKVGVAISDIMAGMYAATAILAAVHHRNETGRGQHIDVPLYDSQVAWLANQSMNFLIGGSSPGRMGTAHPNLVPYQVFQTADSELMLAVGNDEQFKRCCVVLQAEELAKDTRYSTMRDRIGHRDSLIDELKRRFVTLNTATWLEQLEEVGVPAAPVNAIADVLSDEYASERNLVREMQTAGGHRIPTVANPVTFSSTEVDYQRPPPTLGEHTDEVLKEWLMYSDAEIKALYASKAI